MKICFWVSSIATVGGVQRVTTVVANNLSRYYDVTILTHDSNIQLDNMNYEIDKRIKVISVPKDIDFFGHPTFLKRCIKRINKSIGFLNNECGYKLLRKICLPKNRVRRTAEFFKQFNFDIVIGVEGDKALMLSNISKYVDLKTIGWQHNSFNAYFFNKNKYYWNLDTLFKHELKKLDQYVLLNEYDSNEMNQKFDIKSTYLYNPKSFTSTEKCDMNNKRFISVGRFCYAKGFDILIKAIKKFNTINKEWDFYIIGDGEDKDKLIEKIKEYNLEDKVILPGFTNNIKKYYLESSVFVLSSRWEGMPMVILEALEMGCPVVCNNITAIKPLITDGKEGFVADVDENGEKLCDKMLQIANSYDLRKKMSQASVDKSKLFDIDVIVDKWICLLEKVKNGA